MKTNKIKFDVEVNPFLKGVYIESKINKCIYTEFLTFTDTDEWQTFRMGEQDFDIHFLYDDKFSVSICTIEDVTEGDVIYISHKVKTKIKY